MQVIHRSAMQQFLTALLAITLLGSFAHSSQAQSLGGLLNAAKDQVTKPSDKSEGSKEAKDAEIKHPTDVKRLLKAYTGPRKRLAVMDMEVKVTATTTQSTSSSALTTTTSVSIQPPNDFGTGLTEMLTTALIDSGRFIVLERKTLTDIQAEQQLSANGAVDPASAATSGKLLGAQAIIRGAVTEYTYNRSSTGGSVSALKGIGLASTKAEAALVIDVRICDANTGQILDSVKAEGRAKSSASAIDIDKDDFKMSADSFDQSPLGQATRQAIEKAVVEICKRMETVPWEGRIADIEKDDAGQIVAIYINAGSRSGMKEADVLEVAHPGRAIKDPETQTIIGRTKDKRCGCLKLDTVEKDFSIATVTDGSGFEIGDVVRFVDTKSKEPADAHKPAEAQPTPEAQPAQ